MKKQITGLLLLSAAIMPGSAQNLHESFEVEGTYKPEVIIRDRVFTLPTPMDISMETTPLTYSVKSVPATFAPGYLNLPPTGWRATRDVYPQRGYLQLDMGSWLQSNVSAGYQFISNANTQVGTMLQYNSTSLYEPYKGSETSMFPDAKQKLYDGTIGIYGSHRLKKIGTVGGNLYYRLGYFNYYGLNPQINQEPEATPSAYIPTQTFNDINFRGYFHSESGQTGLNYKAGLGVHYFGYRSLYEYTYGLENGNLITNLTKTPGQRETQVSLEGNVGYAWRNGSLLAMDIEGRYIGYSKNDNAELTGPSAYGNVGLKPHYQFSKGALTVRVGANVNFTMNARDENSRFKTMHVAPDVNIDYRYNAFGFYLQAKGGVELQTLADGAQLDYYQQPWIETTLPINSPIDARLGFNFGPFSGLRAGLNIGYKISDNVHQRGLYSYCLNSPYTSNEFSRSPKYINIKGFQVGFNVGYELGTLFALHFEGTYTPQNRREGYFNGYDRPRWILNSGFDLRPIKKLRIGMDYLYRGGRNIWQYYDMMTGGKPLEQYRLKDLSTLNLRAAYQVSETISVSGSVNNLLNCKTETLPYLPQGGLNFLLGVGIKF